MRYRRFRFLPGICRACEQLVAGQSSHFFKASITNDFCSVTCLPMKTSCVSADSKGSNSQRPATKLKSRAPSSKRTKPFARYTFAGRFPANLPKQSREKFLSEVNVNDSNSG